MTEQLSKAVKETFQKKYECEEVKVQVTAMEELTVSLSQ